MTISFEVGRSDHSVTRLIESDGALSAGQVRARIDNFAVTSNNITYATIGESLGYWNFFPTEPGWGRVPAFGFAEIEETRCDDVAEGSRVYGYWPMASHVTLLPGRAGARGFHDTSAHRAQMADVYNSYTFTHADPLHRPDREAQQMLLHPLFFTGFMVDDQLADNKMFGADSVVLSSTSSKTAISTAHLLAERGDVETVALTSERNSEFVAALGCYNRVLTYDAIDDMEVKPSVYADFSGSSSVRSAVHRHLAGCLRHSSLIGGTHWDSVDGTLEANEVPGPTPEFFFAPTQIAKRISEWGRQELEDRMAEAWDHFSSWTDTWLQVVDHRGPDELGELSEMMLRGSSDHADGHAAGLNPVDRSHPIADTADRG